MDWACKEMVLAKVAQDGDALRHASAELKADAGVVRAAVTQYGGALQYASAELRADAGVVRTAVAQHGNALCYASAELKADAGVVRVAVAQHGDALGYASAELRADAGVVRAALAQDGKALYYASAELRADAGVVRAALAQHGFALRHASAELKADRAALVAAAQCVREGGELVAALQRLAFAASVSGLLRLHGGLEAQLLLDAARLVPGVPTLAVTRRARAQGWAWRDGVAREDQPAAAGPGPAAHVYMLVADEYDSDDL